MWRSKDNFKRANFSSHCVSLGEHTQITGLAGSTCTLWATGLAPGRLVMLWVYFLGYQFLCFKITDGDRAPRIEWQSLCLNLVDFLIDWHRGKWEINSEIGASMVVCVFDCIFLILNLTPSLSNCQYGRIGGKKDEKRLFVWEKYLYQMQTCEQTWKEEEGTVRGWGRSCL